MATLQIDEESCKKTLQSLSGNKIRILNRQAAGAAAVQTDGDAAMIDTTGGAAAASQTSTEGQNNFLNDLFLVNNNFRSNQFRLNLPIPAIEEEGN